MDEQTLRVKDDFTKGPIVGPLIRFSLPLMLSLLLQALYGGVDLAVVGLYAREEGAAAAVATGSQIMLAATVVITGLTMGVTVLVGKAVGAGDKVSAAGTVAGQIKLFSLGAVLLTVFMILFAPTATELMNVPGAAVDDTVAYVRICSVGMIFITAYNGISGIYRGIGNSRSPFIFVTIACVVNIVLDLILVAVFDMGASGAAAATVAAQAMSVVFSVVYMKKRPLPFSITRESFAMRGTVKRILRVGSPIAFQDLLVNLSFLIITGIVNKLGLEASNGIGISEKLFAFLSIVPMSFMSALSAFVAQNMGANEPNRALRSLKAAQLISFMAGIVMFLMTFFGGRVLASFFSDTDGVITATAEYLRGCSFEYLMIPLTFCYLGYFNGREHTVFVMAQGLFSAFFVRIPVSYLLSIGPSADMFHISLAVPISGLVNMALCIGYYFLLRHKDKKTVVSS